MAGSAPELFRSTAALLHTEAAAWAAAGFGAPPVGVAWDPPAVRNRRRALKASPPLPHAPTRKLAAMLRACAATRGGARAAGLESIAAAAAPASAGISPLTGSGGEATRKQGEPFTFLLAAAAHAPADVNPFPARLAPAAAALAAFCEAADALRALAVPGAPLPAAFASSLRRFGPTAASAAAAAAPRHALLDEHAHVLTLAPADGEEDWTCDVCGDGFTSGSGVAMPRRHCARCDWDACGAHVQLPTPFAAEQPEAHIDDDAIEDPTQWPLATDCELLRAADALQPADAPPLLYAPPERIFPSAAAATLSVARALASDACDAAAPQGLGSRPVARLRARLRVLQSLSHALATSPHQGGFDAPLVALFQGRDDELGRAEATAGAAAAAATDEAERGDAAGSGGDSDSASCAGDDADDAGDAGDAPQGELLCRALPRLLPAVRLLAARRAMAASRSRRRADEYPPTVHLDRGSALGARETGAGGDASHTLFGQLQSQLGAPGGAFDRRGAGERPEAVLWKASLTGERAIDGGGPFRETLTAVFEELMADEGALGVLAPLPGAGVGGDAGDADRGEARSPPPGRLAPAAAARCVFAGRLLGAAVRAANPVPIEMPLAVWKHLVRAPAGAARPTDAPRRACPATVALRAGLERSLGRDALAAMTWRDLRDAACGAPGVGADALRAATRVEATHAAAAAVVSYFWEAMACAPPAHRAAVLAFATGRARLPRPPAIALVQDVEGDRHADHDRRLPTASTCSLTLTLPRYSSAAVLAERLRTAVELGSGSIDGDGDSAAAGGAPLFGLTASAAALGAPRRADARAPPHDEGVRPLWRTEGEPRPGARHHSTLARLTPSLTSARAAAGDAHADTLRAGVTPWRLVGPAMAAGAQPQPLRVVASAPLAWTGADSTLCYAGGPADAAAAPAAAFVVFSGDRQDDAGITMIGKRAHVYWPGEDGWFEAVVTDFDAVKGEHCLTYNFGTAEEQCEWVDLSILVLDTDKFKWVDAPPLRILDLGSHIMARAKSQLMEKAADAQLDDQPRVVYFELTVVSPGAGGIITLGVCPPGFVHTRASSHPGWAPGSVGYHGDDGHAFCGAGTGRPYGAPFGRRAGDVVGVGVVLPAGDVFFTRNGRHLGIAAARVPLPLTPMVAMRSPGAAVTLNFGGAPFAFQPHGVRV